MNGLLQFIRVYGHDMMNHLTVISGLAQLNRPERIASYIAQVSDQIKDVNRLARIGVPETAAALLSFYQHCLRYHVPVTLDMRVEPESFIIQDRDVSPMVAEALAAGGALVVPLEGMTKVVTIVLEGIDNACVISIGVPVDDERLVRSVRDALSPVRMAIESRGGSLLLEGVPGETVLSLSLPRGKE